MILEGLVTTLDQNGECNIAPMGPRVGSDLGRFELKPFQSSTTFQNLKRSGEGVFHVTDDALLIARTAIGRVTDAPTFPAEHVKGRVISGCCRYVEFRVVEFDASAERARFIVEAVHQRTLRDFFGFNRAKHAIIEAAILATRTDFLDLNEVWREYAKIQQIVTKTGGRAEQDALDLLRVRVSDQASLRGIVLDTWEA